MIFTYLEQESPPHNTVSRIASGYDFAPIIDTREDWKLPGIGHAIPNCFTSSLADFPSSKPFSTAVISFRMSLFAPNFSLVDLTGSSWAV